jgi:hypothetical protein
MLKSKPFLFLTFFVLLFSCKSEKDNTYAIKDFRKSLQPFLNKIVAKGYVTFHDSALISRITDDELLLLGKSENPILRATALGEMLERSSFDDFEIITNHLDDTAFVATDGGEFGIFFRTVSDYLLQYARWETAELKDKTVEKVLTQHNYLRSAYTILKQIEPHEKYYSYIKDMATRPRHLSAEGQEMGFGDIEYALYGLAKFKKPEDVKLIKDLLIKNVWELSSRSFILMKEFPDTAFFEILQKYHDRRFYGFSGNRPGGFSGEIVDGAAPEDFIEALVMQKSENSAGLLDKMLLYLPGITCLPDKENINKAIILEIWQHPCPAYENLRKKIKNKAERILKSRVTIPLDPMPEDTFQKEVGWY